MANSESNKTLSDLFLPFTQGKAKKSIDLTTADKQAYMHKYLHLYLLNAVLLVAFPYFQAEKENPHISRLIIQNQNISYKIKVNIEKHHT